MTVTITGDVQDVTGVADNDIPWSFASVIRFADDGAVITEKPRQIRPVGGKLTVDLEPGYAVVSYGTKNWQVTVPDANTTLKALIEAGVAYPPDTAQELLNAAMALALPPIAAAELATQVPDAVTADLDAREITFTDIGDGEGYFSVGGVPVSGTLVPPAATWSGVASKPSWATDSFLVVDGATTADDITAWLAVPYAGWRWLVGEATLDEPFIVPSNTWLDVSGATITLESGSHCRLVENAAATPLRASSADAVCTAGDNTVTSATGNFTSADVGRTLGVGFVAESTRGANAYGRITAVNSSTSVEIDFAPLISESGGVAYVYGRDENIELRGGLWDRGPGGVGTRMPGKGTNMTTLAFYRVDGLRLEDMLIIGEHPAGRGFAATVGDCTGIDVDYRVDSSADGFHFHGPIRDARVRVSGRSADDLIGCTTTDYGHLQHTHGDIEDVDFWVDGDATGHRHILLGTSCTASTGTQYPDGHSIRRVRVHRAHDSSEAQDSAGVFTWVQSDDPDSRIEELTIMDTDCPVELRHNAHGRVTLENVTGPIKVATMSVYPNTASVVDDLTLINCSGQIDTNENSTTITKFTMRGGSLPFLSLACEEVGSLLFDRVHFINRLYSISNGCDVGVMTFAHCTGTTDYAAGIGRIESGSSVGEVNVLDCDLGSTLNTNGHIAHVLSGGSLGKLRVARSTITAMGDLLNNPSASQVAVFLSDVVMVGCKRIAEGVGGAVVKYAGVDFDNTLEPFYASGPMVLSGTGFSAPNATNGVTVAGAGSARVMDQNLRAAVQLLTETLGDTAYNTNAGLACGVGPVVSDGTNWKHMYTGAVMIINVLPT